MKILTPFLFAGFWWFASMAQAAPKFWQPSGPTETPTPLHAPVPQVMEDSSLEPKTTPSAPVTAPLIGVATPTPTPSLGVQKLDPTLAAVLSAVVPGSGHVYAGDPLKGLAFATVFGLGLWQTMENLQLVPDPSDITPPISTISKDETAGNLFGLVTLAAYGFGIQDAFSTAVEHNRRNHLSMRLEVMPGPALRLSCLF
jgi:hypothetical protein